MFTRNVNALVPIEDRRPSLQPEYDPIKSNSSRVSPAIDSIRDRLQCRSTDNTDEKSPHPSLDLSTLRIHSIHASYSLDLLSQFYDDLMIPNFPLEDERDDLDDWIYCLDPAEAEGRNENESGQKVPAMDVLLLLCDTKGSQEPSRRTVILAGVAFEYYKVAQTGLVSYFVVSEQYRGNGIISVIHPLAVDSLHALHLKYNTGGEGPIKAIFAETNTIDAGDASPKTIQARHRVLNGLGYQQLHFPYCQPPLWEGADCFDNIMLLLYQGPTSSSLVLNDETGKEDGHYSHGEDLPTEIVLNYVTDFFMSVFGYEPDAEERYKDHDYFKFVTWYQKHYPTTRVNRSLPWIDSKAEMREEFERAH